MVDSNNIQYPETRIQDQSMPAMVSDPATSASWPLRYAFLFGLGLKQLVAIDGIQSDILNLRFAQNADRHFHARAARRPDLALKIGLSSDGLPVDFQYDVSGLQLAFFAGAARR